MGVNGDAGVPVLEGVPIHHFELRETAEQGLFELGVIEISEKGGEGVVGRDDQPAMARSHSPALSLADEAPLSAQILRW